MLLRKLSRAFAAVAMIAAWAYALPAMALECPQPQQVAMPGTLRETQQVMADASDALRSRGSAAIPTMIFQLRKRHPDAGNAAITNYLITAYCPVVDRRRMSENRKRTDLSRFAQQVRSQLP